MKFNRDDPYDILNMTVTKSNPLKVIMGNKRGQTSNCKNAPIQLKFKSDDPSIILNKTVTQLITLKAIKRSLRESSQIAKMLRLS